MRAFYFLADTPRRRGALAAGPGAAARYLLYGVDELRAGGDAVAHNLERPAPPVWARAADRAAGAALRRLGGTGGDFAPALTCLREANRADVVVATIDRMGIPLTLLARARLLRAPLVYVSVGLPERLERLRGRALRLHVSSLARAAAFVAYSEHEAESIRVALAGRSGAPVAFVPFGVDTEAFRPHEGDRPEVDVVSVGADPHRDLPLLLRIAEARSEWRFRLVLGAELARELGRVPGNVEVLVETPFAEIRRVLAGARAVALPVRQNTYSGATTVLLQAMAVGRPVVVSRTAAIESGYGLADGENVRLVPPGDGTALERALGDVLGDAAAGAALGARARAHVEASLSWRRYAAAMRNVLVEAVRRHSPS